MAQNRMLNKKISVSEQVADLSVIGQLVFSWSIPHSDDIGFLPYSHRSLKAMIIPMVDIELAEFSKVVNEIVSSGLWKEVEYEGEKFYCLLKFNNHQTLKKDRQPQTLIKFIFDKDPKVSWSSLGEILEQLGIQMEDTGFQMGTEVKRSEEKGREEKRSKEKIKYMEGLFEIFWKAYPKKVAKPKAKQSFMKIEMDDKFFSTKLMNGLEKIKKSEQWTKDGGQFIPHPTTWLNQERWNDEVEIKVEKQEVKKI